MQQQQRPPEGGQPRKSFAGKNRKRKKLVRSLIIMVAFILVLLLVAWLVSLAGGGVSSSAPSLPVVPAEGGSAVSAPGSQAAEDPAAQTWNAIGPARPTGEMLPLVSPDYRMIALPENGRVDISYFNTVTFVGDSITQGFRLYTKSLPAKYCAYKSISPKAIYDGSEWKNQDGVTEVPLQAIAATAPDNLYILIGANSIGNNTNEAFIQYYGEMLRQIRATLHPEVRIYVQSITPVRPDSKFDQNRINELNNLLAQLAYQESVFFVDLNEPLAGDDGYMKAEYAGYDGIHMLEPGYEAWLDYLVTHTAYDTKNPYLEGSPAYTVAQ